VSERDPLEARILAARDALPADAAGAHLDDQRIAEAIETRARLSDAEIDHLARCPDCREAWIEAARSQPIPVTVLRTWRRLLPRFAAAAAVLAAAIAGGVVFQSQQFHSRGGPTSIDAPEIALVATDAHGVERDIRSGAQLSLAERLGFRYGNPRGQHHSLAILGWDGVKVHWYYPAEPSDHGEPIHAEPGTVRLPFDIALFEQHTPGTLTIAAAFDVDPRALADALEHKRVDPKQGQVFELQLSGRGP
jgi:hypothetical protein